MQGVRISLLIFSDYMKLDDCEARTVKNLNFSKIVLWLKSTTKAPKIAQKIDFWGFDKYLIDSYAVFLLEYEITNGL